MSISSTSLPLCIRIDAATLRRLQRRSAWGTLFQTTFNLGCYCGIALIGLVCHRWWLWPLLWWCQSIILSGFLGAAHDCAHGTFIRNRRLNDLAGSFWAATVFFNYSIYKYYHLEHHTHTSVEGDTEPGGLFPDFASYLANLPTTAFFLSFWKMSLQSVTGTFPHFIRTARARREVQSDTIFQALWIVLTITISAANLKSMVLVYWVPLLIYFPMVFWTSLPEHYACERSGDILKNTRSTLSNALFRYVFWNGNFHSEHHAYPFIPSANLPIVNKLIGQQFAFKERSYLLFHLRLVRKLLRGEGMIDRNMAKDPSRRVDYTTYSSN
jgi:fatty acid desaturase